MAKRQPVLVALNLSNAKLHKAVHEKHREFMVVTPRSTNRLRGLYIGQVAWTDAAKDSMAPEDKKFVREMLTNASQPDPREDYMTEADYDTWGRL